MTHRSLLALATTLTLFAAAPASAQGPVPPSIYGPPVATGCPVGSMAVLGPRGPGCYRQAEVSRRQPALFWPGFSAFLATYAFTIAYGSFELDSGQPDGVHSFGVSFIPVAGPFVAMAFERQDADLGMLGAFGGIQAVGLTLMILSHVFPQHSQRLQRVTFTGNGVAGSF